eukprot:CCRYP_013154-RA/>CCRYP_013154-RA protein AED:0.40 eAED:0.40 QI:0/-1/0/1/-1/1/1/0/260
MGPSRSSPSPASLCTKTLACSSLAKANPSSSVPAAAQGRYRIPLTQHKGGGNRGAPLRKQDKHSDTPTAYRPPIHRTSHQMDACGVWIPVKSTWLKAVQAGNFIGWPLLTSIACRNTSQRQWRLPKGTSTNAARASGPPNRNQFLSKPSSLPNSSAANYAAYTLTSTIPRDTIFSDQTGQFPHRSSSGNHYLMVMVDIDFGAILVEPIKNRTDLELTRAYSTLITRLHRAGVVPRKHVLDNEISTAMKTLITDTYKMTYN